MSRTLKVLGLTAVAVTAIGLTPLLSFAGDRPNPATAATVARGPGLDPGLSAAMRRDLKLSDAQVAGRLRTEASASTVERRLQARLGTSFAGAWIPAGSPHLTVAVTTAASATVVDGEGADAKNWAFTAGTIRSENNKCLDVTGKSTANGTPIEIWNCTGGANQQFVLSAAGDLVNPQANKCVDITGYNKANGATLTLWDCIGGANQKWHRG